MPRTPRAPRPIGRTSSSSKRTALPPSLNSITSCLPSVSAAPISTSRSTPPPVAVRMPSVRTPTMSSRTVREAVSAPLSANVNTPRRSRARTRSVPDIRITPSPFALGETPVGRPSRVARAPRRRGRHSSLYFRPLGTVDRIEMMAISARMRLNMKVTIPAWRTEAFCCIPCVTRI
ncbi:hypothetical protein GALL_381880 [mine drainage metagenome]|uniref:Uncharacterized protein n=1 Tax=mine drainage metagenome TaxID=410659 RepID=A0A1J5QJF4_9ZZZZ